MQPEDSESEIEPLSVPEASNLIDGAGGRDPTSFAIRLFAGLRMSRILATDVANALADGVNGLERASHLPGSIS